MMKRLLPVLLLSLCLFVLNVFVVDVQSQEVELTPFIEPGPYGVRIQQLTLIDESRDDWELSVMIMYPADRTQGKPIMEGSPILSDAPSDMSGAPYPLIIYSHGWGTHSGEVMSVTAHLASHGYVVAAATHHDTEPPSHEYVDRPLDIILMLNELALIEDSDLSGMIDTNSAGLMGYSQGATASLQMLGLLSDPNHYVDWCAEHPDIDTWDCSFVPLEETTLYRTQLGLENTIDGQWQPFGDDRIKAVFAMAPSDFALTSESSLTMVTTPTMILHGTNDQYCDYDGNAVRTYTHLGTEDRYLITLINGDHGEFITPQIPQHFATIFFGYYLQEDESYMPYLTPEGLPPWTLPSLAWGPYEEA